jgi:hypothetical protein
MYTDHKKQLNHQSSYRQRTNTIDYINNLILEHKIDSYEDFQRKISSPIKIRLLKDIGYIGQNLVRQLIKIHNTDIIQEIISKNYLDLLNDNFILDCVNYNNLKWLQNFFVFNNINFVEFICDFIAIHSTNYPQINTFVLQGPTNTGTTLLL